MKIIKADNYQTWYLEYFKKGILIDPWLTNKLQPDGSFFIQRSKLNTSCLSQELVERVNAVIITAPFEDHLHLDTLKMLPNNITIYTSKFVKPYLLKNNINNQIEILSEEGTIINSLIVKSLPTSYPYFKSTFSILFEDKNKNKIFHEGHRVNFKYIAKHKIKANVAILTAEETKLFGLIQLGMSYKKSLKAAELLESDKLFITGNSPDQTKGFISNFLYTKPFNLDALSKKLDVYFTEGDSFSFR